MDKQLNIVHTYSYNLGLFTIRRQREKHMCAIKHHLLFGTNFGFTGTIMMVPKGSSMECTQKTEGVGVGDSKPDSTVLKQGCLYLYNHTFILA